LLYGASFQHHHSVVLSEEAPEHTINSTWKAADASAIIMHCGILLMQALRVRDG
jgi:hypothetical protein